MTAEKIADCDDKGKFHITVNGFDYYETRTGDIESGAAEKIALWMLDPDYDGVGLFPKQIFFIADCQLDVTAVIPGTGDAAHMIDNLGAMRRRMVGPLPTRSDRGSDGSCRPGRDLPEPTAPGP